jgi:hypothetical protein
VRFVGAIVFGYDAIVLFKLLLIVCGLALLFGVCMFVLR